MYGIDEKHNISYINSTINNVSLYSSDVQHLLIYSLHLLIAMHICNPSMITALKQGMTLLFTNSRSTAMCPQTQNIREVKNCGQTSSTCVRIGDDSLRQWLSNWGQTPSKCVRIGHHSFTLVALKLWTN